MPKSKKRKSNKSNKSSTGGYRKYRSMGVRLAPIERVAAMVADAETFQQLAAHESWGWSRQSHDEYLDALDHYLHSVREQGAIAYVEVFDLDEFIGFCAELGVGADSRDARDYYAAEAAEERAEAWEGTARERLLMGRLDRMALAVDLSSVADAEDEMVETVAEAMVGSPEGAGQVTVLVSPAGGEGEDLTVELRWVRSGDNVDLSGSETLLGAALAVGVRAGGSLVLRTPTGHIPDGGLPQSRVRGWMLGDGIAQELDDAAVFSAFCTDAETGEPLPPEYGTLYGHGS